MRYLKWLLLFIIIAVLSYNFYNFKKNNLVLKEEFKKISNEVEKLKKENKELQQKIEYFKIKENLLKEIKKQYNYKESGENLIIIIPKSETNTRP